MLPWSFQIVVLKLLTTSDWAPKFVCMKVVRRTHSLICGTFWGFKSISRAERRGEFGVASRWVILRWKKPLRCDSRTGSWQWKGWEREQVNICALARSRVFWNDSLKQNKSDLHLFRCTHTTTPAYTPQRLTHTNKNFWLYKTFHDFFVSSQETCRAARFALCMPLLYWKTMVAAVDSWQIYAAFCLLIATADNLLGYYAVHCYPTRVFFISMTWSIARQKL